MTNKTFLKESNGRKFYMNYFENVGFGISSIYNNKENEILKPLTEERYKDLISKGFNFTPEELRIRSYDECLVSAKQWMKELLH